MTLTAHLMRAAELAIEPAHPGFLRGFPGAEDIDKLYENAYLAVHHRYVRSKRPMSALLA